MPSTDGTEGPDGDIENPNDATGTCLFDAFLTGTLSWCRDGQSIPPGFCDVIHSDGMVVAKLSLFMSLVSDAADSFPRLE